jgi:hypothetical protein
LSPFQLVFLGTAQGITSLVFEVPTGVVADTLSRKWSLVISSVLMGSSMVATGLVTAFPALVMTQMAWGIAWTFASGADVAWMTLVGTSQHDVTTIDPSTIRIWTEDCQGGPVAPIRYNYEDKATPWPGGPACGCHTLGADGILDLNFHFRRADVENGLHLGSYPHFSYVRIFVTAQTFDGCGILGSDCVRVQ